ncbi:CCA tRNA nucleotidyltransferase [Patescibacteria group bacterium]
MKTKVPAKIKKHLPKKVWEIFKIYTHQGYEIYLVGAGVRNLLQEKAPIDCDLTTNAPPEVTQSLFDNSFYDNEFGMVGVPVKSGKNSQVYEITTFRTEWGYSDKRRPDQVRWGQDLEEDLKRRDFTWNAIVIGPHLKNKKWDKKSLIMIDIFQGQKNFNHQLVRAVGNPKKRFNEDALRMMRAIRFAAQLGFQIESKTFEAIKQNADLIKHISAERIREELFKLLGSNYPADGYQLLDNSHLSSFILPEIKKMLGVNQKGPNRHHQDDVWSHAIKSLKASRSKDPIVNLAILIHDIGKPLTIGQDQRGNPTFYNHEVVGASIAKNIARRLRFSKKDQEKIYQLVRWHQFSVDERQTDKAIRRFIRNVGQSNISDLLELRRADRIGGGARETSWRFERFKKKLIEVQKQPFSVTDLKINGREVMKTLNLSPGPLIGKILNRLFKEVEDGQIKNEKKILLAQVKKIKKDLSKLTKNT